MEIAKLSEDFSVFKNNTIKDLKLVNIELTKLKNEVNSYAMVLEKSGLHAMAQIFSELVISGISETVASRISPDKVTACVFNVLKVSSLTSDVLTTRKVEVKRKPSSNGGSKKQTSSTCSYVLKLKS